VIGEVARVFLRLGCTSFGGPVAHIGYFHEELVRRRQWVTEAEFADLVALCQFLPGPASSQLVFALGKRRAGLAGALVASACFTLPSALLMMLFAWGVTSLGGVGESGWLHGLKLAAVPVVAQAVWGMGRTLCPDAARLVLASLVAVLMLVYPGSLVQVAVIVAGALAGVLLYRRSSEVGGLAAVEAGTPPVVGARRRGALVLGVWAGLLLALPLWAAASGSSLVAAWDGLYRAGSLVFGGGHVILPLLRAELVPPGFVSDEAFLAGYGAAQAVPGPLFTLSAYLGVLMSPGPWSWAGGLAAVFAMFLPAWLLVGGALPFWQRLRTRAWAQAALRGANAAVVGVLAAALWVPVGTEGIRSWLDLLLAVFGFVLLERFKVPAWALVAGLGLACSI